MAPVQTLLLSVSVPPAGGEGGGEGGEGGEGGGEGGGGEGGGEGGGGEGGGGDGGGEGGGGDGGGEGGGDGLHAGQPTQKAAASPPNEFQPTALPHPAFTSSM